MNIEAGSGCLQVIWIRRDVAQPEGTVGCGHGCLAVSGDCVMDGHSRMRHRRAGRVDYSSFNGAGIAQRLCETPVSETGNEQTQNASRENSLHAPHHRWSGPPDPTQISYPATIWR